MTFRHMTGLSLLLLSLNVLVGCGSGDVGLVEGTVTLDGQPLPNAMLEFFPKEGGGLSAGRTDESGHYELHYGRDEMGAKVGEHLVQIRTAETGGDYGENSPELLPTKYNNESELTVTVDPGRNTIDFDLDSEGEIVQPPSNY